MIWSCRIPLRLWSTVQLPGSAAAFQRRLCSSSSHFWVGDEPSPQLDWDYILSPDNTGEIAANISRRKGVGDVRRVRELHAAYRLSELSERPAALTALVAAALRLPNRSRPHLSDVADSDEMVLVRTVGHKRRFDFPVKDFQRRARKLNMFRMNNLGLLTGSRTYYLKCELAQMEMALVRFALTTLMKADFQLVSVPDLLNSSVVEACGVPVQSDRTMVYSLDSRRHGDVCLSGTAEMGLAALLSHRRLPASRLPLRMAAVSRCFRPEISNLESESGLYRVHQFTKVEMFGVCAGELSASAALLDEFVRIQQRIFTALALHFVVYDMPPNELGAAAYQKYDMEAWMAGRGMYGEVAPDVRPLVYMNACTFQVLENKMAYVSRRYNYFFFRKLQMLYKSSRATSSNACTFQSRSHTCGQLSSGDAGRSVTLCGWLQFSRMGRFVTLRDGHGVTQLVIPQQDRALAETVASLPLESVLQVSGQVLKRPEGQHNPGMATGEVEVHVHDIHVYNKPDKKLPFNIRSFNKAKEALRLQYRYLDLRHAEMQRALRLRSQMIMDMRKYLAIEHSFVDVETPTLFRRTPGGAQEFVVPTRTAGRFYSLVQSPQQFKQLLVIGGLDRYFQIARCYRDEGARPDRQPEFTQLDIELGFSSRLQIQALVEGLLQCCWPGDLVTPFPHMSYSQAMSQYGSDKPDLRFRWKLVDVTSVMRSSGLRRLEQQLDDSDGAAIAVTVPGGSSHYTRAVRTSHERMAAQAGLTGVAALHVQPHCSLAGTLTQRLRPSAATQLVTTCDAQPGDMLFVAVGGREAARTLIGRLRVQMADELESRGVSVRSDGPFFLWVDEFPLFVHEEGRLVSVHHPFTRPHEDDKHLVFTNPTEARGQHFDLVLNGWEVGGGSMRIHEPALQRHILEVVLGEDTTPLQHLLEALASGAPPHGGIALGLDRLVALAAGAASIRDVIAFPKSSDGRDLMADAPSEISHEEYEMYHLTEPKRN